MAEIMTLLLLVQTVCGNLPSITTKEMAASGVRYLACRRQVASCAALKGVQECGLMHMYRWAYWSAAEQKYLAGLKKGKLKK